MKESKWTLLGFGVLGGVLAALLAFFGNPGNMALCIACFIRDTAGAMGMHNANTVQYVRPEIVGIVVGAMILALVRREYKSTAGSAPVMRFALGVMTMIGALVFLGCPLRMVLRMAAGDLNAWVALIGFVGGIATGALFLRRGFSLGRSYEGMPAGGGVLSVMLVVVLVLSVTTGMMMVSTQGPGSMHAPVLLSLVCGLAFGAIAQHSRMCFAGSFRNLIFTRDVSMILVIAGVFVAMLVYNIAGGTFHLSFAGQPIAHSQHLWSILGMYAVGLAATLAGGCPLRQLVLAGQGSSDAACNVLGMFVGAAIAHNFKLASSAEGTTPAGRIAVVAVVVILLLVGLVGTRQKKD